MRSVRNAAFNQCTRNRASDFIKLDDNDLAFHQGEYERLRAELQAAYDASTLREMPEETTRAALNDLLVRVRMK